MTYGGIYRTMSHVGAPATAPAAHGYYGSPFGYPQVTPMNAFAAPQQTYFGAPQQFGFGFGGLPYATASSIPVAKEPAAPTAHAEFGEFTMTIGGKQVKGTKFFPVINPATGKPFVMCPDATSEQVNAAVDAAKTAFKSWSKTSVEERRKCCLKASELLGAKEVEEIAKILTTEQGKPLAQASWEIGASKGIFAAITQFDLPVRVTSEDDKQRIEVHHRPIGVVAAICPWNFPVAMAAWKIPPAVMAGNTVVLKPSPFTPLSSLRFIQAIADAFPAGVVNVVSGGNEQGRMLVDHPDVSYVSFTGSVATGRKIYQACAKDFKRFGLELGGNDAAIVCDDVDIEKASKGVYDGAFGNCGQVCIAVKRAFVHEKIFDKFVSKLVEHAKNAKVGDGFEKDVECGPINNKMQFDRVNELVEDAKRHGAKIHTGGKPGKSGYFYEPTIITNVKEGIRIVDEEQFGPALPVMPFKTEEEAIERANATKFGLGGSVWTSNAEKRYKLCSQLQAGTVWGNKHAAVDPAAPFGGFKQSGLGRALGPDAILEYTELQSVFVSKE